MNDSSLYRDESRVRHMLDAVEQISNLAKGLTREQMALHDGVTERILFNLVILGEAANNITRDFAGKNPDVDWRGIAGIRHKIVHDYAEIDFDTIWDILLNEIPQALNQIKALANTLTPKPTLPPPNMADFL